METPHLAQAESIPILSEWIAWFLLAIMGFSAGYWLFTTALLWLRQRASASPANASPLPLPPVVFLRPVKRGVPHLADKASRLVAAARLGDWVVFAVDTPEDKAICLAACQSASEGVHAEVVFCSFPPSGVWNPKIAKLIALTAALTTDLGAEADRAAPEHWILSDSEAIPERAFMDRFRAEWAALEAAHPGGALLTAGYRFAGAHRFFQQLDHFPSLLTLWPGLVITEWGNRLSAPGKGLGFTLGACTGLRKSDIALLGGWESMLSYLAEDHRLGAELAKTGRPTFLSREVLLLDSDPLGGLDWLRHQHRVSFTYRVCNPAGFLGMGLIQGIAAGLFLVALHPAVVWSWAALAALLLVRMATSTLNARALGAVGAVGVSGAVGADILNHISFALMSLLASVVETGFWAAAWLPLPVRWGRRTLRVGRDGQFSGAKSDSDQTSLASEADFHYQSDT